MGSFVDGVQLTARPLRPLWRDAPEMLDTCPAALMGAYQLGVYDGKLWAINKYQPTIWVNFDGEVMDSPVGANEPTNTAQRGWYVTPVGLFFLYENAGNTYMARWQTGDTAYASVNLGASATFGITGLQTLHNLAYLGANRLLWGEYSQGDETPLVFYSDDAGASWSALFTTACTDGSIDHFHGIQCHTTGWLRVWCASGEATTATVVISGTTVVLTDDDNGATTLTYGTEYETIQELVDYINDSVTEWSAELVYSENMDHAGLEDAGTLASTGPTSGGSCLLAANAQVLYDASVPSNLRAERVLVFTGDSTHVNKDSILFCEDIPHLLANGDTWKARWELDTAAATRSDETYMYGMGAEKYRVIQVAFSTDGKYAYYRADVDADNDAGLYRIELRTGNILKLLDVPGGYGWAANTTPEGICLVGVSSQTVNDDYTFGSDGYVRLYGINQAQPNRAYLLRAWYQAYGKLAPAGAFAAAVRRIVTFKGYTYVILAHAVEEPSKRTLVGQTWPNDQSEPQPSVLAAGPSSTVNCWDDPFFGACTGTPLDITAAGYAYSTAGGVDTITKAASFRTRDLGLTITVRIDDPAAVYYRTITEAHANYIKFAAVTGLANDESDTFEFDTAAQISVSNCTKTRQAIEVPHGIHSALQVDSTNLAGSWYLYQAYGATDKHIRGRGGWVTLFLRFCHTLTTGQVPMFKMADNADATHGTVQWLPPEEARDGTWRRFAVNLFLQAHVGNALSLSAILFAHYGGAIDPDASVYLADLQLVQGQRPLSPMIPNVRGIDNEA